MAFALPPLPYDTYVLTPHISQETLEYHHGHHHKGYVTHLNNLVPGTPFEDMALEKVVRTSSGAIFDNAAQVWNHAFYWNSLSPNGGGTPSGALGDSIDATFGSFDAFKEQFSKEAAGHFGSGWAWLVTRPGGTLAVTTTHDAGTPLTGDDTPLLAFDLWEHAYYIDYRDRRAKYVEAFWNVTNWDFAAERFAGEPFQV